MTRTINPADLAQLPVLSTNNTYAMARGLVTEAENGTVPVAQKALARVNQRLDNLKTVAESKHVVLEPETTVGAVDRRSDRVHRAHRLFLLSWAGLVEPENINQSRAEALADFWYGEGAFYAQGTPDVQWAETESRLNALAKEGLEPTYEALGGKVFLTALTRLHQQYGEVTGITATKEVAPEPAQVGEAARSLREAMRDYIAKVIASIDIDEPESEARARALLRPYIEWSNPATPAPATPAPTTPA